MKSFIREDGRWQHKLRQSWMKQAELCPEQARLSAINQLPPKNTDAAAIGTAVHAGIELHLTTGADLDTCMEAVQIAWWNEQREPGFVYAKYSSERTAWAKVELWFGHWWNQFQPRTRLNAAWWCEIPFLVPLHEDEHRVIELSGTIDAYNGGATWDWKTSGRGEYEAREYQRWAVQPTIYTYAINAMYGQNVPFNYGVVHDGGLQTFMVHRDERDWAWLTEKALDWATMIEADLPRWPKVDNHWLCSERWCGAWKLCKGAHFNGN